MPGILTLAATPIGNTGDATLRLVAALSGAGLIAAEDTRRLHRLAKDLEVRITGRVLSFFEGNEARRTEELIPRLLAGEDVLLVSDAGMPTVSDPGFGLVAACAEYDIPVTVLPGPSAALAALAVSGLPTDRFTFEGFLPRKPGPRRRRLAGMRVAEPTLIFFESPRRVPQMLADLAEILGPQRPAAVCRELTKTYEEVRRGSLAELARWADGGVLGEVVIVVAGRSVSDADPDAADLAREVDRLVAAGLTRRSAADEVALRHGVSRREVFNALGSGSN